MTELDPQNVILVNTTDASTGDTVASSRVHVFEGISRFCFGCQFPTFVVWAERGDGSKVERRLTCLRHFGEYVNFIRQINASARPGEVERIVQVTYDLDTLPQGRGRVELPSLTGRRR